MVAVIIGIVVAILGWNTFKWGIALVINALSNLNK